MIFFLSIFVDGICGVRSDLKGQAKLSMPFLRFSEKAFICFETQKLVAGEELKVFLRRTKIANGDVICGDPSESHFRRRKCRKNEKLLLRWKCRNGPSGPPRRNVAKLSSKISPWRARRAVSPLPTQKSNFSFFWAFVATNMPFRRVTAKHVPVQYLSSS